MSGFFVGFSDNVGDALTFNTFKNDLTAVLHTSVVTSASDPTFRNNQVTFKVNVQEALENLFTKPGAFIPSDTTPKQRSREHNDHVSNRSRSKGGSIDHNIADRTTFKALLPAV
jgi:hypothetical protein